jgi:peptidyl-prolyl cis-trans isomerase SurA
MKAGEFMKRIAAALVVTLALAGPAFSQKVISQIAAKVNKDIILESELKKAQEELKSEIAADTKLNRQEQQKIYDERSADILRDLIDRQLILQQASDLGLDANLEVTKQIEKLKVQYNFPTEEALAAAMAQQGTSIDDVKDSLRYKSLRAQVLRHEVTGKIVVTTEEMKAYYEAHKQDFDRPPGVALGIIAVLTEGLSDSETEAKKKTINDALAALKKGEDFGDVARKYSEDATAPSGGDLGFVVRMDDGTYGLATPEMEEVAGKLAKGQITDILSNPQNHTLVILKVFERHDGGILPFELAQNDIYSELMDSRAEPRVRAYLTKLRAEGYVQPSPGFIDTGAATGQVRAADTNLPRN